MSDTDDWRGRLGALWASHADALEQQLGPAGEAGIAVLDPSPGEAILDLGCGSGGTTARLWNAVQPRGSVLGIDLSADQIAVAQRRFAGPGLTFEVADAAHFPFGPQTMDGIFSRFGCMFFDEPVAAFRNLASALRHEGRAVFVVWQEIGRNPWADLPAEVGRDLFGPPEPAQPGAPGPFGWASPDVFQSILQNAGFRNIAWRGTDTDLVLGDPAVADPIERAVAMLLRVGPLARRLRDHPEEARAEAARRLAPRLQPYLQGDWVRMPGAIWIVEAKR